jgi:secreted trypsin-like serine protease
MDREWLSDDANVCQGDSGGPALDDEGRVIGVASRGPASCDAAVYGDVAAWGDFIIDVALQAAETGSYDPPFWTDGTSELPASELAVDSASLDDVEMIELAPALEEETPPECTDNCAGEEPPALGAESACDVSGIGAQPGGRLSAALLLALGAMYRRRRR